MTLSRLFTAASAAAALCLLSACATLPPPAPLPLRLFRSLVILTLTLASTPSGAAEVGAGCDYVPGGQVCEVTAQPPSTSRVNR